MLPHTLLAHEVAKVFQADLARAARRNPSTGDGRLRGPVRTAVADIAPVVLGVLPLGMAVGMAARAAAVTPLTGLGTALLMFGGTANLTALSLVGTGTGAVAVLGAVLVVNARLALYGAGMEPRFRAQPAWFRWLAPHLIVDQTYVLAAGRPELGTALGSGGGGSPSAPCWAPAGAPPSPPGSPSGRPCRPGRR
jgi:hypothetical protein